MLTWKINRSERKKKGVCGSEPEVLEKVKEIEGPLKGTVLEACALLPCGPQSQGQCTRLS